MKKYWTVILIYFKLLSTKAEFRSWLIYCDIILYCIVVYTEPIIAYYMFVSNVLFKSCINKKIDIS